MWRALAMKFRSFLRDERSTGGDFPVGTRSAVAFPAKWQA
jgi:hypothetical protein